MEERLKAWRIAVMEAVGTMQFDSVEEFARQLGLDRQDLAPLPMSASRQAASYMDGAVEADDVAALQAPVQAFQKSADRGKCPRVPWRDDPPQGPCRKRSFVPLQPQEPFRPNPCQQLPRWRRLPRCAS